MFAACAGGLGACARGGDDAHASAAASAAPAAPLAASAAPKPPAVTAAPAAPVPVRHKAETTAPEPARVVPQAVSPSVAPPTAPAGPRFISLSATPSVVHAGQAVSFAARTSTDIATVTAFASAYTLPFTQAAPGLFVLAFTIPSGAPGFFHGTYALNVVAKTARGASVSRSISVTFE